MFIFFQNAESLVLPLLPETFKGASVELVAYLKGWLAPECCGVVYSILTLTILQYNMQ